MSEDVSPYGSTESKPPIDPKVQRFNRTKISMDDFERAIRFIDAAKKHSNETPEHEALWIAAIIYYAKPFSHNERNPSANAASRLSVDAEAVLGPRHALHKRIIAVRNKAVAHGEWDSYPTSQIPVAGNAGGFATVSRRWHPVNEAIDLDEFRAMVEDMRKACLGVLAGASRAQ